MPSGLIKSTQRRPKGYVGTDHETIGSDILAVLGALRLPEEILGKATFERLKEVKPEDWYPIGWLLELMEELDRRVGRFALMRMGRKLFKLSHEARVRQVAHSARDVLYGMDAMYHHANRGKSIGGWRVLQFSPGHAELEKTTPHHCAMEEGILLEALSLVGCRALVEQAECFRKGATACIYVVTSSIVDRRWSGDEENAP
jgi:hypothetical protein